MSDFRYVPSLGASESVDVAGGHIDIGCTSLAGVDNAVTFMTGPMGFVCTPAQAVALGDALIRIAHHYTAALAEHQQKQIATAVDAQAVQS